MAGLKGQNRTPGASVRIRRNTMALGSFAEFIGSAEVIALTGQGVFAVKLDADGGLANNTGELAIKLAPTPALVLAEAGLAVLLDPDAPGLQLDDGLKVLLSPSAGLDLSDAGLSAKLAPGGGIGTSEAGLLIVGGIPITTEVPAGTIDGSNASFTISEVPGDGETLLFCNGLLMSPGATEDYTRVDTAITFNVGAIPEAGDVLLAVFLTGPDAAGETPSGIINGINDTFTLANTPEASSLLLFFDGVLMAQGAGADYTLAEDVITFEPGSAPLPGDKLFAVYQKDTSP